MTVLTGGCKAGFHCTYIDHYCLEVDNAGNKLTVILKHTMKIMIRSVSEETLVIIIIVISLIYQG